MRPISCRGREVEHRLLNLGAQLVEPVERAAHRLMPLHPRSPTADRRPPTSILNRSSRLATSPTGLNARTRDAATEFLAQVRADHYVVVGARRFRLPDLDTIEMLAAARGDAAALYLGGDFDDDQADELKALFNDATLRSATFPAHEYASMMIDLLHPVEPTLP